MTKIICVVDNEVINEAYLKKEHGLSFWIETQNQVVLFDTGQTSAVFSHNLKTLGLSPHNVDALALSHAHYDHTGGLDVIISTSKRIPLFALTDIFRPRYSLRNGEHKEIGLAFTKSELSIHFTLRLSDDPQEIVPNLWTTGEIKDRPERVGGSEHLHIKTEMGWKPDQYKDDMSLVLRTASGLVLICGCCHAGMINTLYHVEKIFGGHITTVLGGTHLVSADDQYLEHVIDVIKEKFSDCQFFLNHCTGNKATQKLINILGNQIKICPAGTVITL